jgi:hypothetical protein
VSGRFVSYVDSQPWNYIPEFQRRIKINNALMTILKEASKLDFRTNVILPSIFELERPESMPVSVGYKSSLSKFLNSLVTGEFPTPTEDEEKGAFQKLSVMSICADKTKIPIAHLEKQYPSEMHVINSLKQFYAQVILEHSPASLVKLYPEFKPLLLQYNPQEFCSDIYLLTELAELPGLQVNELAYLKAIQIQLDFL